MPTPSLQTLVTDAKAVLALQNMTTIRSTMAVALANANTGTPLSPSLTNQQLINEAFQVMTLPKSDIESIIVNQLMKFLAAPPAPGGAGANKQVIWNDAGTLTGDPNFTWDGPSSRLTVSNATITGNLTVGTGSFGAGQSGGLIGNGNQLVLSNGSGSNSGWISNADNACIYSSGSGGAFGFNGHLVLQPRGSAAGAILFGTGSGAGAMSERYRIASDGVATWSNVGGVAGTAMTLNSTGLGVGVTPSLEKLEVNGGIVLSPPTTPATLTTNGQLTVNATSNTNLRFSYRGSDGVTRTADITLA